MIDTVMAAKIARDTAFRKASLAYPEQQLIKRQQYFVRECLVEFANLCLAGGYDQLVQYPDSTPQRSADGD